MDSSSYPCHSNPSRLRCWNTLWMLIGCDQSWLLVFCCSALGLRSGSRSFLVSIGFSWVYLTQQNEVFMILRSNVIRLAMCTTRFLTGRRPPRELRDKVACKNLPTELWRKIGESLTGRLDILRFRSVCTQWRLSLPFPTQFLLQVPMPPNDDSEFQNTPYFITEVNVYTVGGGYVTVAFEEVDQGRKFRPKYVHPPGVTFDSNMMSFMASPNHPFSQLRYFSKAYHLRMAIPRFDLHRKNRLEGQWDLRHSKFAKKAVLLYSKGVDGVNPSYARASDLTVVFRYSCGTMKGRLALLRLGGSSKNGAWDTDFCTQVFHDITSYRGQLCAIDRSGRIFLMDYNSLEMTQVAHPPLVYGLTWKELFESLGELYLADIYRLSIVHLRKTYKLCMRRHRWIEVERIGKQILDLSPSLFGRPKVNVDDLY